MGDKMSDNHFMSIAIKEAALGMRKNHGGPFGAVIVRMKDSRILAKAHNMVLKNTDPSSHAEITAIRAACKKLKRFRLDGCAIYSSSEPCPMCLSAIMWSGMKKVYYGASARDVASIGFQDMYQDSFIFKKHPIEMVQIDHKDALKIFKGWREKLDKVIY